MSDQNKDPIESSVPTLVQSLSAAPAASVAMWVLALMGAIGLLKWASTFFVPVAASLMVFYALDPLVEALERRRVPRTAAAGLVVLALISGLGWGIYAASDDVNQLIAGLPEVATKLRQAGKSGSAAENGGGDGAIEAVRKAANQLEQAAQTAGASDQELITGKNVEKGVQRVVVEKPKFDLRDYVWNGALSLAGAAGQLTSVCFLSFFMLSGGAAFRRRIAQVAGPELGPKRAVIGAMDEIGRQMRRYMIIQASTSAAVGLASGLAFWAIGLKHPIAWGIAAGLLNFIPYVGSFAVTAAAGVVAFVQFGVPGPALAVAGASMTINLIEGNFVTPLLVRQGSRINATAMFTGVLAWAWLWGGWGLLLGMPLMMVIKAVCDKVERLKPVGRLMGE